jgi:hypothetical protein
MNTPYPLGRVLHHDERSRAFGIGLNRPIRTTLWTHRGAVLHQGQTNACTGHAVAQCLMTSPLYRTKDRSLTHAFAMRIYAKATELDEFDWVYPPTDQGSSALGVCKAAKSMGLISRYEHAFGLQDALAAITRGPVIAGTTWHQDMFYPDAAGFVVATGDAVGGHEYVLLGVDMRRRFVTGLNSWGQEWGRDGMFKMTFDTLGTLLNDRGDVTALIR